VKPNTVLFGSALPSLFFTRLEEDQDNIDILIVAGTSLAVSPANSVVNKVRGDCARLIVNRDRVGEDLGIKYFNSIRDIFYEGDCDNGFLEIIRELGWEEELNNYRNNYVSPSQ